MPVSVVFFVCQARCNENDIMMSPVVSCLACVAFALAHLDIDCLD
jgi:hypothetical protein